MKTVLNYFLFYVFISVSNFVLATETSTKVSIAGSTLGLRDFKQQEIEIGIRSAFNETLSKEGILTEFTVYKSSDSLQAAIKNKEVNIFFGTALELLSIADYIDKKTIAAGLINGKHKMRLYLLVRKDSNIQTLQSLQQKSIDIPSWLLDDIGGLYLNTQLLENKLTSYPTFFSTIQKSKNSNQSIINLFFKKNDAALVTESEFEIATELNPQIKAELMILLSSEAYPSLVSAGLIHTDANIKQKVLKTALELSNTTKGKNTLRLMKSTGFIPMTFEDLSSVSSLLLKHQQLIDAKGRK